MNTFLSQNSIINYIKNTEILLFIIYIVLSFISAFIINKIFISILTKIIKRTKTDIDDRLVAVLNPAIYKSVLYIGFYIALGTVIFPAKVDFVLKGLIKSMIVIHWSLATFRFFRVMIGWVSNKDNTTGVGESNQRFIKPKTIPLFDNLGKIIIFLFSIYFIMLCWGINLTAWIASAGILSVVLGFAAKDTLGNLFSGIFIMADSPYKEGDYINLDTGERGYVRDVGVFWTRIQTRNDIEITIPNSVIANSKIINESGGTHEKVGIRVKVGVAYGTEIKQIKDLINEVAVSCDNVCDSPAPLVRFREFGSFSINFELLAWIEKPEYKGKVLDELLTGIYNSFNTNNIEIPFPQRTVHIKKTDL